MSNSVSSVSHAQAARPNPAPHPKPKAAKPQPTPAATVKLSGAARAAQQTSAAATTKS